MFSNYMCINGYVNMYIIFHYENTENIGKLPAITFLRKYDNTACDFFFPYQEGN